MQKNDIRKYMDLVGNKSINTDSKKTMIMENIDIDPDLDSLAIFLESQSEIDITLLEYTGFADRFKQGRMQAQGEQQAQNFVKKFIALFLTRFEFWLKSKDDPTTGEIRKGTWKDLYDYIVSRRFFIDMKRPDIKFELNGSAGQDLYASLKKSGLNLQGGKPSKGTQDIVILPQSFWSKLGFSNENALDAIGNKERANIYRALANYWSEKLMYADEVEENPPVSNDINSNNKTSTETKTRTVDLNKVNVNDISKETGIDQQTIKAVVNNLNKQTS